VAQSNELPAAAALARGQATYWLLDWLGVGAAGFYEQAMTVEDGLPREGLRFYGGYGVLKVGRVHTPSWRRPG
jgi:2-methylcitrate dehydratase PrpD